MFRSLNGLNRKNHSYAMCALWCIDISKNAGT